MRKFPWLIPLVLLLGGFSCPKEGDEKIVVIIEDQETDTEEFSKTEAEKDTSLKTDIGERPGVKTMSLTGGVMLLRRDLSNRDVKRLLRHIQAMGDAVSAELESTEPRPKSEEMAASRRKRGLNLFLIKLWSLKRAVEEHEGKDIPQDVVKSLEQKVEDLEVLARRIEGRQ